MAKENPADYCLHVEKDLPEGYREVFLGVNLIRMVYLTKTGANSTAQSWTTDVQKARVFGNLGHPLNKARLASGAGHSPIAMTRLHRLNCVTVGVPIHQGVLGPWYTKGHHTLPTTLTLGNLLPLGSYRSLYDQIERGLWHLHDISMETYMMREDLLQEGLDGA